MKSTDIDDSNMRVAASICCHCTSSGTWFPVLRPKPSRLLLWARISVQPALQEATTRATSPRYGRTASGHSYHTTCHMPHPTYEQRHARPAVWSNINAVSACTVRAGDVGDVKATTTALCCGQWRQRRFRHSPGTLAHQTNQTPPPNRRSKFAGVLNEFCSETEIAPPFRFAREDQGPCVLTSNMKLIGPRTNFSV